MSSEAALATQGVTVPCLTTVDAGRIREHLASGRFFWLDLTDPSAAEVDQLGEIFAFHSLALEDTAHFGQRPKLDDYGDYGFLVFYGARQRRHDDVDLLREVHLFVSGQYIVSVHREPLPALDVERSRLERELVGSEQVVLYGIVDSLTDTFFPLLAAIGDEIDTLEEAVIASPTHEQLQRLFGLKRQLVSLRKVVTPQRDLFAHSVERLAQLPGFVLDKHDYFRDVEDHLIQASGLIDSYRELLRGATDLYMSTVNNEQAGVMKQLAVVGTVFLPLSFITGFFGMNFGWLVNQGIAPAWTFWALGVGSILATCAGLLVFFRRKGWA
jgi:magnesium transporter